MEQDYYSLYTEIKRIGKGNYGTAHVVKCNDDDQLYVAKKISLEILPEKEIAGAIAEATLLKNLHSPHIVGYKNSFYDGSDLIIVMEYCDSKSLLTFRWGFGDVDKEEERVWNVLYRG